MSFAWGLAVFLVVAVGDLRVEGRTLPADVLRRMRNLLGVFIAAVLYLTLVYHLTNAYFARQMRVRALHPARPAACIRRCSGGATSSSAAWCRWSLVFHPRLRGDRVAARRVAADDRRRLRAAVRVHHRRAGVAAGDLPGLRRRTAASATAQIATYAPRLPELLLGLGGVGIAFLHHRRSACACCRSCPRTRPTPPAPRRPGTTDGGTREPTSPAGLRRAQVVGQDDDQPSACARALRARGLAVQPFKKGPDYIDPMWLTTATRPRAAATSIRTCRTRRDTARTFRRHAAAADVALVEGNKGLYDGLALDGSNSNAALAKALGPAGDPGDRRARHDARHRAADPRLPGLRPRREHRRRDPQQPGRQPARGQAARW